MDKQKVFVFDTTLRDGEQSAGVSFSLNQKLKIAHQLQKLGVDIIEAGFPRTSPGDLEAVQHIAKEVRECTICALARCIKGDIEAAWEGVKDAANPRIHTFINTSDIQIENQLKKTREQVLEQAIESIKLAKRFTSNVEFSPMDATRSDKEFLFRIIEAAIAHGATTINVPDSVGYAIPSEHGNMFKEIIERVPNSDKAVFSCHAHNDLGLASANALSAVQNGVRQIEVAMNGIGERAGNTALEEVVMALKTREEQLGVYTTINTKELYRTSQLVERISGMPVQWNKAIVGKNSFRHGSGIHQDGILKKRETWEIIDPASIGIPNGTQLVMGKLSGSHAFAKHVEELGYQLPEEQMTKAFEDFKNLADKKKNIDDRDIEAIVAQRTGEVFSPKWTVDHIHVASGTHAIATATIRLKDADGNAKTDAAAGDGPIDAICVAVNRIIEADPSLTGYSVQNVTEGIDAQGTVVLRIKDEDDTFYSGQASDTDVIIASAKAYVNAVNRMLLMRAKKASMAQ
ncbi:MAG: 2-isopropylmalate synthase [Deltaproteobacteria bacterium]|nr:2-isopropylmalate synthase [Deltaproteobacteria bacterium]MBN2674151.1 2-isopropylmalate synthase [Deltaproteobacteria bacterium]